MISRFARTRAPVWVQYRGSTWTMAADTRDESGNKAFVMNLVDPRK